MPNYFYYVVPKDLITIDEIPQYAGLIYVNVSTIQIVKDAPIINKDKQDITKLNLIDKFYWRMKDREYKVKETNIKKLKETIAILERDNAWYDNELSLKKNLN